ncbi:hypothetical protein C6Q10_12095 [Burkholderia multivorans]|nr:hypothetical protein C6Q10_12095 [Burkholderia multivorans]
MLAASAADRARHRGAAAAALANLSTRAPVRRAATHRLRAVCTRDGHRSARHAHGTALAAYRSATSRTPTDAMLR